VDCVTKEHTQLLPQYDIRPLQHNFPLHTYATQEYSPDRYLYNEHEQQRAYAQQRVPPRTHHDHDYSQFEPGHTAALKTRVEDIRQPIEQQHYAHFDHPQDQALPKDNQLYYQSQAHPQDQYHDPNIVNGYYPGRDYMFLSNNTYGDGAGTGILGYEAVEVEQPVIADRNGYGHYVQHDEGVGIEEELDYELYGQISQPEKIIDQDECESSVLPSSFWRPRHRY